MAANPPGKCCGEGHIHDGTPRGSIQTFGGIESYISPAPDGSTSKVIFFITDIIGHKFVNAQLMADGYAAHGYHVVMPDLFNGDPWLIDEAARPAGLTLQSWLVNHMPEQTTPIINKVMAGIKELKPEKIGAVGYCFGAKYVTRLLAGEIDAGFNAHPSFVTLEELAAIKKPLSIAAAETDSIFTTELRHQSELKLREIGATYQINLFSGVEHGFAVRGDLSKPWEKWCKDRAFEQALQWFQLFL
ncbi:Alpha/Beta hydrolase protein [Sphaerosporella brunnea]|uniref:Alpha/Beta hydrolase protein n=1 Tax=Sphaerosporella brunnea TaxID=1250544 RepID=A0A5J5F3P3_9PEZI|nr:Alpha/Beta hydrolase protein [Sphaerosporella brunnea]